MEGNGGSPPELSITYAGHMPYCGPDFGLAYMHVIRDQVNKSEDDEDAKSSQSGKSTPRRRGKGQKREAPGIDSKDKNPKAPEPGAGIFKTGTDVHKGIFRCPSDMPIDPPQGHNQSEVLDLINESINRLKQLESKITGDLPQDITVLNEKDTAEAQEKHKGETAAAAAKEESAAKKPKGGASASSRS